MGKTANPVLKKEAESGVATIGEIFQKRDRIQISIIPDDVTGDVVITCRAKGLEVYEAVEDGTISLADPLTLLLEGDIGGVKATAAGKDFTLVVAP